MPRPKAARSPLEHLPKVAQSHADPQLLAFSICSPHLRLRDETCFLLTLRDFPPRDNDLSDFITGWLSARSDQVVPLIVESGFAFAPRLHLTPR
jgi:hypothetical protein